MDDIAVGGLGRIEEAWRRRWSLVVVVSRDGRRYWGLGQRQRCMVRVCRADLVARRRRGLFLLFHPLAVVYLRDGLLAPAPVEQRGCMASV